MAGAMVFFHCLSGLGQPSASAATLTAVPTIHPNMGLYKPGETVNLQFTATGVTTGQTLTVTIKDAHDVVVKTQNYTVSTAPNWSATVTGYNTKLGFYRVFGSLSDGTQIAALGTRPQGFITYAIVPDPALRPALDEFEAFFGIQGGVNSSVGTDILAFMGWRWAIDGNWNWKKVAPTAGGAFVTPTGKSYAWATNGAGGAWPMFNLTNLTKDGRPFGGTPDVYKAGTFAYNTGALKPEYYDEFQGFCAEIAAKWPALYAEREQEVYEITWEPIQSWGYLGTDADLVKMYELAAGEIRAASPTALVAGPCMLISNTASLTQQFEILDLGLADYLDAFTAHPYMEYDVPTNTTNPWREPELAGQPTLMRTMRNRLRESAGGVELPMFGTEMGYRTRQNVAYEINQARRLTRSNLLVLGEGWRSNTAFYFADYPTTDSLDGLAYWDWGFFYNLDTAAYGGFSPTKVSPKPIVAAYAAMTSLVEGRKSVCDINWLGNTIRGYALEKHANPNDVLLALWDFGATGSSINLDVGSASVDVFDMWGNKTTTATSGGMVTLNLGKEPIYVRGVAASQWGSARPMRNAALGKTVTVSSTSGASTGNLAVDGDSVSYLSRWVSVSQASVSKWIAVDLGQDYEINEVRFWTGQYQSATGNNTYQLPLASYKIQRWTGSAWVDIVSRTGNTKAVVAEVFTPVVTSQVRLLAPAWQVNQIQLYEIEVLATSDIGGVIYENEDLSVTTQGASSSLVVETASSNGEWVKFDADGVGDWVQFTLPNVPAGAYAISVLDKTHHTRAQYQLSIGGTNLGSAVDQYGSPAIYREILLGNKTFPTTGNQTFRFTVTGRHAGSSGYNLALDAIVLDPL